MVNIAQDHKRAGAQLGMRKMDGPGKALEFIVAAGLTLAALVILMVRLTSAAGPYAQGIVVSEVWARPTLGQPANSAAYMTIENTGDAGDRLLGARAVDGATAELHRTVQDNGVMRMRAVEDGIAVPARGSVALAPDGYHVMLIGLKQPLAQGEAFPLTLTFEKAGDIEVTAKVAVTPPAPSTMRGSY